MILSNHFSKYVIILKVHSVLTLLLSSISFTALNTDNRASIDVYRDDRLDDSEFLFIPLSAQTKEKQFGHQ